MAVTTETYIKNDGNYTAELCNRLSIYCLICSTSKFVAEFVHDFAACFVGKEESSGAGESSDNGRSQSVVQGHYTYFRKRQHFK